jgi:hypothetical protein
MSARHKTLHSQNDRCSFVTQLPELYPSDEELARLLGDLRVYNDDHGDTGAVPLEEDNDDDPVSQSQSQSARRMSTRKRPVAAEAQSCRQDDGSKDCRNWKWEGGSSFDEHDTYVLRQVKRNRLFDF